MGEQVSGDEGGGGDGPAGPIRHKAQVGIKTEVKGNK